MIIDSALAEQIYLQSYRLGIVNEDKAIVFYLSDVLEHRLSNLSEHFPENTLHAIAIKTCNHPGVLKHIVQSGFGLEAASLEEVKLAKEAGAENEIIVFDSPVKTREEIEYCHKQLPGILLNANSLEELKRYPTDFNGKLGLRINPLVQIDGPVIFNVSGNESKFGVGFNRRKEIVEACMRYPQITCLHLHIGSALKSYNANVLAVKKIAELADQINTKRTESSMPLIDTIDIGGGIDFEHQELSMEDFVAELSSIPNLLERYKLITEFGTYAHRDCSFVISDIEYVVDNGESSPSIAYLHVGADLFVRKVYSDLNISYPYSIIRKERDKDRSTKRYHIAGPLCFAGDILYQNLEIPELDEGDKFVLHATGANTWSMWSGHCGRTKTKFVFLSLAELELV